MSVQDIVEAYETRLRERWTPDGGRRAFILNPNVPDGEVWLVPKGALLTGVYPDGVEAIHTNLGWEIQENTREICGND